MRSSSGLIVVVSTLGPFVQAACVPVRNASSASGSNRQGRSSFGLRRRVVDPCPICRALRSFEGVRMTRPRRWEGVRWQQWSSGRWSRVLFLPVLVCWVSCDGAWAKWLEVQGGRQMLWQGCYWWTTHHHEILVRWWPQAFRIRLFDGRRLACRAACCRRPQVGHHGCAVGRANLRSGGFSRRRSSRSLKSGSLGHCIVSS